MKAFSFKKNLKSTLPILLHVGLGLLFYFAEFLSILYYFGILFYFLYHILKNPQSKIWPLLGAGYISGVEIFLRMTEGYIFWEFGKYYVMLFLMIGLFRHGFKIKAWPFLLYILLLLPGVYVAYLNMDFLQESFRKTILFNLSGPLSLFVSALYCYQLRIKLTDMFKVLDYIVYPLIAMAIYIIFYQPDMQNVFASAESSEGASGGYSGNQVSTILGLGMFILFVRFLIPYRHKLKHLLMMGALALLSFRALLTFSRGGVVAAGFMMIFFSLFFYFRINLLQKAKASIKFILLGIGVVALWGYSVATTDGMIVNRYTGKNSQGIEEEDISTGRLTLIIEELAAFEEKPFFGLGVGLSKFYREKKTGIELPSHNEITRMIGEHGMLGVLALLVLLVTPLGMLLSGNRNLFLIPFVIFWGATINHSAMRVAAPGFIYGLALLNVNYRTYKKKKKKRYGNEARRVGVHRQPALPKG